MNSNIIVILCLFVVLYMILKYLNEEMNNHENWINYRQYLGNIETGVIAPDNKIALYRRDRFRKPYNWPACYMTEHPIRHCRHFD
jgi:hypothetical protein